MLIEYLSQLPWDVYRPYYEHLEGPELFGTIILNEEAVVTYEDRVHFNLDAQAESLILAVSLPPLPLPTR